MLSCPYPEILYGGAAGGGKTDALLGDFASGIDRWENLWQGVIFRRSFPQLEEIERRSLEIFGPAYGAACYSIGNKQWNFPNGAKLRFRFLNQDKDTLNHQGQQYSYIGFDELTQWPTNYCYNYMWSRLRSPGGAPCFVRSTTNPGGPGHNWVKAHWRIDEVTPKTPLYGSVQHDGTRRTRVFIPAKVQDNQILMINDPGYLDRLGELSDPTLISALRDGRWDIFAGQAFPEWDPAVHVIKNGKVPDGVMMWRACDWGYEKPYCVLWFYADYDGNVTVCNELYGKGDGDKGTRTPASVVRDMIETVESENQWWVPVGYLDPQCWAQHDDQPCVFDRIGGHQLNWQPWAKGPNSRINQKMVVHDYLKIVNGKARLRFMERCKHTIRTFPGLPTNPLKPEDVDTTAEDHGYDTVRGGLIKKVSTRKERRRIYNIRSRHKARRQRTVGRYGGF